MNVFLRPFTIIVDGLKRKPLTPSERIYYYYVFRVIFTVDAAIIQFVIGKIANNTLFTDPRTWIVELVFIVLYAIQTGIKQWFSIIGSVKGSTVMNTVDDFEKALQDAHKIPTQSIAVTDSQLASIVHPVDTSVRQQLPTPLPVTTVPKIVDSKHPEVPHDEVIS